MKNSISFILFLYLLGTNLLWSDSIPSLNKRQLKISDSSNFQFYIAGHLYGDSFNQTGLPINTIFTLIDSLNVANNSFLVSLGDIFLNPEKDIESYSQLFFSKINSPIYNAVGNHDVMGSVYKKRYKKTYYDFTLNSCKFIFLDTECDDSNLSGEQLNFFNDRIKTCLADSRIKSIFIFSHRPIWSENNPALQSIFKFNTRSSFKNNFEEKVLPSISTLAQSKNVYWFSGSMSSAPASFFYHYDSVSRLRYFQTAVRGTDHDGVLKVNVKGDKISFTTVSLTGRSVLPLESYNMEFYNSSQENSSYTFNYRLLPLYIKQTLFHPYFWYGFILCLILSFCVYYFFIRFKK